MEEFKTIISLLDTFGIGIFFGVGIFYIIIKFGLASYLFEKGKNLATKEDVEAITDKVESVKVGYAKVLEELRSDNQLRLSEIEREKRIKKEVYLDAVEAIHKTHTNIAGLANLSSDDYIIHSAAASADGKVAKIHIVGSEETVKAVSKLTSSIAHAYLELFPERTALITRKDIIILYETYRTKSSEEINRYLDIFKNMNLEGVQDKRLLGVVNKNIDFQKKQRDGYTQKIDELRNMQSKEILEFSKMCMERFFAISELLPDAVLAVRKELNMEISDEAYLDIHRESVETGKRIFDNFLKKHSKK